MAIKVPPPSQTLLFFLLLLAAPPPSLSFSYFQCRTLISLTHSLMIRVSNLRAARGDSAGAERARLVAEKLEQGLGLGFWRLAWSVSWDYVKNFAWRDIAGAEMLAAVGDLNELLGILNELTRMDTGSVRASWVQRNYGRVLRVSKSLFRKFLKVFRQSGPLRELVEAVQREVMDGGLLKDCLDLGSNDLKGVIQVFKELTMQFSSTPSNGHDDL